MASEHYKNSISELQIYFGISQICAQYIFHRALRSRRSDDKHLPWNVQMQNALVKADKCLGINWDKVYFGYEEQNLLAHGINVNDMDSTVFRWTADPQNNDASDNTDELQNNEKNESEWITVSRKKKKKEKALLAAKVGVFQ